MKGANEYQSGYLTNTELSALSGYKEFHGLYISERPILIPDEEGEELPNGFISSAKNFRLQIKIEMLYQEHNSTAYDAINYQIDNYGNKFNEIIKCRYHWIKSDNSNVYRLVPSSEVDYTLKNLNVKINITNEQISPFYKASILAITTGYI